MALTLVPTRPGDLYASWDIYTRYFGSEGFGALQDSLDLLSFPYTCWSLKEEEHFIGGFSFFYLPSSLLKDILTGRQQDSGLTMNNVIPFPSHQPFNIYIAAAAIDPDLTPNIRRLYAGRLIASFASVMLYLRKQGHIIHTIYTLAVTQEGIQAAEKFGFHRLYLPQSATPYFPYHYQIDTNGLKRLQHWHRLAPRVEYEMIPLPVSTNKIQ